MNRGTRQRIVPTAPFSPMLLLRWMLVLVLAMDLVGSPWHAHHHDGSPDGYVVHAAQVDGDHDALHERDDDETASHLEADHSAHFGHSLLALRTIPLQLASVQLQDTPQCLASPYRFAELLTPPTVEVTVRWRPGKEREPIPLFRTVPPDGRAPPTLHA